MYSTQQSNKCNERNDSVKEYVRKESLPDGDNANSSFEVKVCFTQNATWQGKIQWIEQRQKQTFRSALEMLTLMDEALSEGEHLEGSTGWKERAGR